MLRAGGWGVESLALPVVEALYRGLQAGAKAVFRQCYTCARPLVDVEVPEGRRVC